MVNIKISRESLEFLVELSKRLNAQDNRCTAKPYFLVIRTSRWRVAHDDYHTGKTKLVRVDLKDDPREFQNFAEYVEREKFSGSDATDDELKTSWDELEEFTMEEYFDEENVFLTDKAFEEHVEVNGHNLGRRGEYFTYMKHAFRNREMDALFKAVEEIGGAKP